MKLFRQGDVEITRTRRIDLIVGPVWRGSIRLLRRFGMIGEPPSRR